MNQALLQNEQELSVFLERQRELSLATWGRNRSSEELTHFVERRFAMLDDAA